MAEPIADTPDAGADTPPPTPSKTAATAIDPAGEAPRISPLAVWGTFGLLVLMNTIDSIDRWLLAAVARPISDALSLDDSQASWLATVWLLAHSFWCPIIGFIVDRFRRPRLMAIGITVWSLAVVGTGMATSYEQLQLARALVGIGGATFSMTALTLVMDFFPRTSRGRAIAVFLAAMPLGAALGLGPVAAMARDWSWQTAFLIVGAPGLALALIALVLPEPIRGATEGVEARRLRIHEQVGPSQHDYFDLSINSSYNYSLFGLAFAMFAAGGLIYWLPGFLKTVRGLPNPLIGDWLGRTVPAAMIVGLIASGWLGDRGLRRNPRVLFWIPSLSLFCAIAFLLLAVLSRTERLIQIGLFATIALIYTSPSSCFAILANVVMPNMRAVACAVTVVASHLLGDLWSPTLLGWVAETFGDPDTMATPFGQALTALGATPTAEAGRDPENLTAALLATAPALMIAGIVFLAGVAHLPREMALMLAKLRAAPSRWLSLTPRPPQPRPEAAANVEPPQPPSAS